MLALVAIMLFPLLFLLGTCVVRVLHSGKERGELFWEDRLLAGIPVLVGLAEGAHLGALARGQSVLAFQKYFCLLLGGAVLLSGGILFVMRLAGRGSEVKKMQPGENKKRTLRDRIRESGKTERFLMTGVALLFVTQLLLVILRTEIYQDRDLTLETVMSFLSSGKIHEINPVTGFPYEAGLPLRLKILCLPTLYAALSTLPGVTAEGATWHFVPALMLTFSYLAYVSLGRTLFSKERNKRLLFLLVFGVLIFAGDYLFGMEGFGLLHLGFHGTTLRGAVLLPWLFSLCLRKKWKLGVCIAAAEACVVWTLYGLGASVFILGSFLAWNFARRVWNGRKEGTI